MKRLFASRDTARAQDLRNAATPAEDLLWRYLRGRRCAGAKFSRQMPVGPYFVDFLCREHRLVVEVDGPSHDLTIDHDEQRTKFLTSCSLRVIRFANEDVMTNLDGVVRAIELALNPTPLAAQAAPPASGRGVEGGAPR